MAYRFTKSFNVEKILYKTITFTFSDIKYTFRGSDGDANESYTEIYDKTQTDGYKLQFTRSPNNYYDEFDVEHTAFLYTIAMIYSYLDLQDPIISVPGYFPITSNTAADYDYWLEPLYLYGWTSSEYYDIDDNSKPLTIYTKSSTPEVDDETYISSGLEWNGRCYTGVESGVCDPTIGSKTDNTITVGSKVIDPIVPDI